MARFIAAFITTLTLLGAPAAFASRPSRPTRPTRPTASASSQTDPARPTVMFVLRGTLGNYTAATRTSDGSITDGSITVTVSSSNLEGEALSGTALTLSVTPRTRVVLHGLTSIANGDRGIVMVRAPKGSGAMTLETSPAFGVIDQASSDMGTGGKAPEDPARPTVMFVLRGTLSDYTAATSSSDGSITVTVSSSNLEGKAPTGTTLTLSVTPRTRVVLHRLRTITSGDRGIVKVRAVKGSDVAALLTSPAFQIPAFQIIDQASSN